MIEVPITTSCKLVWFKRVYKLDTNSVVFNKYSRRIAKKYVYIFEKFGSKAFEHVIGIPMKINKVLSMANTFLYLMRTNRYKRKKWKI